MNVPLHSDRRALVCAAAVIALVLAGCDGADGSTDDDMAGPADTSDVAGDVTAPDGTGSDTTPDAAPDTDSSGPCLGACSGDQVCLDVAGAPACRCAEGLRGVGCVDASTTDLTALTNATCRLEDGTRSCWGAGYFFAELGLGEDRLATPSPTEADDGVTWRALAAGDSSACGLDADDKVWCWGSVWTEIQANGVPLSEPQYDPVRTGFELPLRTLSAGRDHFCGVQDDGDAWCWGKAVAFGASTDPDVWLLDPQQLDGEWHFVDAGRDATCGVRRDGTLHCLGLYAALPHPDVPDDTVVVETPTQIGTGAQWRTVSVGFGFACAITLPGELYCWGANQSGQAAGGPEIDRIERPTRIGSESEWADVVAANSRACGLKVDGSLWCWGREPSPVARAQFTTAPTRVGDEVAWRSVTIGDEHVCAARDDASWTCWGQNATGQLGTGWWSVLPTPTPTGTGAWSSVSVGISSGCGVRPDGTLECWGRRTDAALEPAAVHETPMPFPDASDTWRDVSLGSALHHCAVEESTGERRCWGRGSELFPSFDSWIHTPLPMGDSGWATLANGNGTHCGIRSDGTLWCWGDNELGQAGVGDELDRSMPAQVGSETDWTVVATDRLQTCGIRSGELYCWGSNVGAPFDPALESSSVPVRVGSATDWLDIAADYTRACAVNAPGELWCWGNEISDDGPVRIGTESGWSDVAIADDISTFSLCAIRDGGLYCWGLHTDPITYPEFDLTLDAPTDVSVGRVWIAVVGQNEAFCAIADDDSLHCFGRAVDGNVMGQPEYHEPLPR